MSTSLWDRKVKRGLMALINEYARGVVNMHNQSVMYIHIGYHWWAIMAMVWLQV